jgi:hypothetical protein
MNLADLSTLIIMALNFLLVLSTAFGHDRLGWLGVIVTATLGIITSILGGTVYRRVAYKLLTPKYSPWKLALYILSPFVGIAITIVCSILIVGTIRPFIK